MAGPYSPDLQIWGVAKETVPGTAVAPTNYPKLETFSPKIILGDAMDQSIRADMADVHGTQQTTAHVEIDFTGKVAPDDLGYFLVNLFGADAVVGASPPYAHTFSLLNTGDGQPVTHTWTHFNGLETRRYAGCRVETVTFKYVPSGLVEFSGKMFATSFATTAVPTPTYTSIVPVAAWNATLTLSGSALAAVEFEWTIARTITPVFTVAGVQAPYKMFAAGDFKSSGKAKVVYDATTVFTTVYLAGTYAPIVANFQTGATVTIVQMQLTSTQAYFANGVIAPGSTFMELDLDWTAQSNATDAGASGGAAPVKAVVQNATATY